MAHLTCMQAIAKNNEWANVWNMGGRENMPASCKGPCLPITESACGLNKPLTPEFIIGKIHDALVDIGIGVAEEGVNVSYRKMLPSMKLVLMPDCKRNVF